MSESRVPDAKAYKLTPEEVKAMRESLGKCVNPATGKPVSARREEEAVLPVAGSVTGSADGNGRGTCGLCGAHVALSGKGFLTAHNVRKNPVPLAPPRVRLVERQAEVTDTGARVGSPDAAMRDRTDELSGAYGTGTVTIQVRVKGEDGKSKTETQKVPNTEANIRTALRQELKRKHPDADLLHKLGAMLKGATGTVAVPVKGAEPGTYRVREAATLDAPNAPQGGRDEGMDPDRVNPAAHVPSVPGAALVNGGNMSCAVPVDSDRVNSKGGARNAIGWSAPVGRLRPDRMALSGNPEACQGKGCTVAGCVAIVGGRNGYMPCHKFRELSKSQARRYWAHVARAKERGEAAKAARRPAVKAGRSWPVTRQTMQGGAAVRQV